MKTRERYQTLVKMKIAKKIASLMVLLRVICFIGKWILKQCSFELQQDRVLLYWFDISYTHLNFLRTPLLDTHKFYKPMGWKLQMTSGKTINYSRPFGTVCLYAYIFILCNQEYKGLHECIFFIKLRLH